jgi:hypothetical protein
LKSDNADKRALWVIPIATAAALALLVIAFRVIGGGAGIGIGGVFAVAYLVLLAAWAENDFGRLDMRVLPRRDAWRFRDPRRRPPV